MFYRSKTRGIAECIYSDKTWCEFFERLQKFSTKSVSLGSPNNGSIVRGNISIQEKQAMPYQYSLNTNKECFIRI